ncbi:4-(cytidine 5'-diphospho)-2-C-methyl-D-erythritol kinase [Foetidibacter luteolus]|uniref:4-(cytidine 5'-diphospho)-2-C-methyl-D-erythritol kinase n=1 Tax=Foetidibacter luteolus TaxID=2608880 RepID=UPI00129A6EDE|nr:4-(cytidine 5'-diphospho)-2-C-methyl-D-erythritol kinase [Foetidibacter luteolus]
MIYFPGCKINLGLNIISKRNDGYHNLETVFYPLPLKDAVEIIRSADAPPEKDVEFTTSGLAIRGGESDNLCIRAYTIIKKDFPGLPKIKMHLHKNIPMGAGLGGGSADGAFVLKLLNDKFKLGLSEEKLMAYALQLGSDCPFFINNRPAYAEGRGDLLQPLPLDLSGYRFVLVNPGIHVKTSEAFAAVKPGKPSVNVREVVSQPVATWRNLLKNDFEAGVAALHPEIADIKEILYKSGAVYASMTGSGSTVFGIFPFGFNQAFLFPGHYIVVVL